MKNQVLQVLRWFTGRFFSSIYIVLVLSVRGYPWISFCQKKNPRAATDPRTSAVIRG